MDPGRPHEDRDESSRLLTIPRLGGDGYWSRGICLQAHLNHGPDSERHATLLTDRRDIPWYRARSLKALDKLAAGSGSFCRAFGEGLALAALERTGTTIPSISEFDTRKLDEWRRARTDDTRLTEIIVGITLIVATLYTLFVSVRSSDPGAAEIWMNVALVVTLGVTFVLVILTGLAQQFRAWAIAQIVALIFILGSTALNFWSGGDPVRALLWIPWLSMIYVQNAGMFLPRVALAISGGVFLISILALAPYVISGSAAPGTMAFDVLLIVGLMHFALIGMLFNVASRREMHFASRARAEIALAEAESRAQMEAKLAAARLELASVDRSLTVSALAAFIAHEIKQPLTAIISSGKASLNWLRRETPAIWEAEDCSERILQDANRASQIVISMRDLLRRERRDRERLDIASTLRDIESILREEVEAQSVTLTVEKGETLPTVDADPVQLRQVIINLALNAMEASIINPRGERPVTIRAIGTESCVTIEVEDRGEGFKDGGDARIFEAFYTTKPGGMGLGLVICRTIIEQHGGTIKAEALPRGARVLVTLPAASP